MHFFNTQELARQRQETLLQEARLERLLRSGHKRRKGEPALSATPQSEALPKPDFAAIRRDLRTILSEWHQETGAENLESMIDAFMRRLETRLETNEPRKQTELPP